MRTKKLEKISNFLKKLSKEELAKVLFFAFKNEQTHKIDLSCLNFSFINYAVDISNMVVYANLYQSFQIVEGDLFQDNQIVKGNLCQNIQQVGKDLIQCCNVSGGDLIQNNNYVKGDLYQGDNIIIGDLIQTINKEEIKESKENDNIRINGN